MEFIHHPYQPGETIAAISTPPGEGGISIIRISGSRAIQIAEAVFSGKVSSYDSHTAHLGMVRDREGKRLDEALLLLMRAPRSYTGEDTVELQCHGGMLASKKVLEACLAAGARGALPGEFTLKAFMNGKLDLAQAEAVQKLISAKNEQAFAAATKHLEGALSKKIEAFQKELVDLAAILEAWVDFPEEGIEFASKEQILTRLEHLQREMGALLETFEDGKKIDQGISLCIVGPPNAGKSSLLNALLGQERAIVTPIAGTTRDLIHEEMTLGGLHFQLTDTAGIRHTEEVVEAEGIRRSKAAIQTADIILLVIDAAKKIGQEESELFEALPKERTIVLWNKVDLSSYNVCQTPFVHALKISAKERIGFERLKQTIAQLVWKRGVAAKDEVFITTLRHKEALATALRQIDAVLSGLKEDVSPEFLTADLRSALSELGKMIGTNITEEILSSIFSQFCIGK
jgi:tRNA modification GTPase